MITVRQPEYIGCTAMDAINRSAVIVMAAQPFLDWLRQADPTNAEFEPGGSETRANDLLDLLPEYATEEEGRADLKEFCSEIFELKNNLMAGTVFLQPGRSIGASTPSSAGLSTASIP